jgi:receptor protein-tyrosine kinase
MKNRQVLRIGIRRDAAARRVCGANPVRTERSKVKVKELFCVMDLQDPNSAGDTETNELVQGEKRSSGCRVETRVSGETAGQAQESSPQTRADFLDGVDAHLVSLVAPDSPEAEQYRRLRHWIEQMHEAGEGTMVGVCSPTPGDGKSTTAINLAGSLAQDANAKILLVEVDLRRPSVTTGDHLALDNPAGPGLVDAILDSNVVLEDVVRPLPQFNLAVLPAGRRPVAPYEILKSPRFGELLAQARRRYDYVILDAPPVVPVPDCRLIAKWVDGFVMVVAAHRTPRAALEEALNLMGPENLLGLVFNFHSRSASRHYGYYGYGYGYGYGHEHGRPEERKRERWWTRILGK